MSQENVRRKKIAQGLVTGVCLAAVGFAIGDMLKQLRKHS